MQVGDRVRIIKSIYMAHSSRRPGNTGMIVKVFAYPHRKIYCVKLDNRPKDDPLEELGWSFYEDELTRIT